MIILYQNQMVWAGMNDLLEHGCLAQTVLFTNLLTFNLDTKEINYKRGTRFIVLLLNWPLFCLKLNHYSIYVR
jgi:hypothetical protein